MGGGYLNNNKLTSNKKYVVLLLIFLLGFLTIYINTSYGLFKKKDYLTSIDFVTGTLDYKIENVELENNSITLAAGSERKLTLTLTSLNPIDSKYELYYLINGEKLINDDIEIGYTDESVDSVKGTISSNSTKEITVSIKNNSKENVTITFGCEGGLINNELVMNLGNSLNKLILSDDLIVAYTYVGTETEPDRFPNKDEGYVIRKVTCNGMDAKWNNETWSLAFSNVTGKNITCNFEIDDGTLATDYIMTLAETNTHELRIDEHAAVGQQTFATTEYRYYGATPNNYVWFNEELWRIIGVFDVDDGSNGTSNVGKVEKRLKIIRANPIGSYSWDSSSSNINAGSGVNEWSQADIMTLLNSGAYYNRTSGNCYNGANNATTPCDFSENSTTSGLTNEAKEMIGNAKWYLGAVNTPTVNSMTMYINERGNNLGNQCINEYPSHCNDGITRKKAWIGKVGLLYPSDYGFSTNLNECSSIVLDKYSENCYNTTWLFDKSLLRWLITPAYNALGYSNYFILHTGNVGFSSVDNLGLISPTVYLLPSIKIIDGVGTDTEPYLLSLN